MKRKFEPKKPSPNLTSGNPRAIVLIFVILLAINALVINSSWLSEPALIANDAILPTTSAHQSTDDSAMRRARLSANETRMLEVTSRNRDLVYVRQSNMVILSTAKGGTSKLWEWVYRGVTGQTWASSKCGKAVHDKASACWQPHASYVHALNSSEQRRVLTSEDTLRVAVYRNPLDRLVSAFKSKFMCAPRVATSDPIHNFVVPNLRKQCGLPSADSSCMNISEFASALDNCRRKAGQTGFAKSLRALDMHIRPQRFFFEDIDYDIVMEINDMQLSEVLKPIRSRFAFGGDGFNETVVYPNRTGQEELSIPYRDAIRLHRFASVSDDAVFKYVDGFAPSSFDHQI